MLPTELLSLISEFFEDADDTINLSYTSSSVFCNRNKLHLFNLFKYNKLKYNKFITNYIPFQMDYCSLLNCNNELIKFFVINDEQDYDRVPSYATKLIINKGTELVKNLSKIPKSIKYIILKTYEYKYNIFSLFGDNIEYIKLIDFHYFNFDINFTPNVKYIHFNHGVVNTINLPENLLYLHLNQCNKKIYLPKKLIALYTGHYMSNINDLPMTLKYLKLVGHLNNINELPPNLIYLNLHDTYYELFIQKFPSSLRYMKLNFKNEGDAPLIFPDNLKKCKLNFELNYRPVLNPNLLHLSFEPKCSKTNPKFLNNIHHITFRSNHQYIDKNKIKIPVNVTSIKINDYCSNVLLDLPDNNNLKIIIIESCNNLSRYRMLNTINTVNLNVGTVIMYEHKIYKICEQNGIKFLNRINNYKN